MNKQNKKVLVGMSGGTDSSVAAALLKQQGYEVIGVFLKFWSEPTCQVNSCCNQEALLAAKAVCKQLNISFYVFDVKDKFKREVVDYFVTTYESGATPNPCVVCNKFIKFGWLLEKAKELGCEMLATGHYARLRRESSDKSQIQLLKGKDKTKDQSYFLWQLDQRQLAKIIFPLGEYSKSEVKKLAKQFELPINTKKESQDICFVGTTVVSFLNKYAKRLSQPGDIVDKARNIIGKHTGLAYYTIGQRKGLGGNLDFRASCIKFSKNRPPVVFVIKLDVSKNQLVVGEEADLYTQKLAAQKINWLADKYPEKDLVCRAKIRYAHQEENCRILVVANQSLTVIFDQPQRAITPGQSIVFYKGDRVLGGGIIVK